MKQTLGGSHSIDVFSNHLWDVLVVGAGPSGSMAARQLATAGARVLLVDKADFPRRKPCGCYLNRAALQVLDRVGLGQLTTDCAARPVECVRLGAQGHVAEIAVPRGAGLSRETLDTALVQAAMRQGAHFLPRTSARLGEKHADFRTIHLQQENSAFTLRSRIVVVADGIGGRFLQRSSEVQYRVSPHSLLGAAAVTDKLPERYRVGTIQMAIGAWGYVGLLQIEDGRIDVAAAFTPQALKRDTPGVLAQTIVNESGLPPPSGLAELRWLGTPPLTRSASVRAAHRLFLIGDAGSYVEPFTGEGIAWALASGSAVAPFVQRAVRSYSPDMCRQWNSRCRRLLGRRHQFCRILASRLRYPRQVVWGIAALSRAPFLAAPIVRWLNSPLGIETP